MSFRSGRRTGKHSDNRLNHPSVHEDSRLPIAGRCVPHALASPLNLLPSFGHTLVDCLAGLLRRAFWLLAAIQRGRQGACGEGKADDRHNSFPLLVAIWHA